MKSRFFNFLFKPIDASTLCLFRIFFGLILVYQVLYYIRIDYTYQFMSGPQILFSHSGLEFLQPLPEPILKGLQIGMLFAAILFTTGLFYRWATAYLLLVFSYFSFIDKTLYNNHLYLFALLLLVMLFLDGAKKYRISFTKKEKPSNPVSGFVPNWQLRILQFLIIVVYFYGGIAKFDRQWLNTALPEIMVSKSFGEIAAAPYLTWLFAYGGLLFDLSIGFLLLWRKTRGLAILMILIFNLTNGLLLFDNIGVFPFFMIGATILFIDANWVGSLINEFKRGKVKRKKGKRKTKGKPVEITPDYWNLKQQVTAIAILGFVLFHLVFPLRHLWLTDNPEWTGVASDFAWRMKLQNKKVIDFKMTIQEGKDGQPKNVDFPSFLSRNQLDHLLDDPYQIVQLAHHLQEEGLKRGMNDPMVKARVEVAFNGRPPQLMLDPMVDLASVDEKMERSLWIMPLKDH